MATFNFDSELLQKLLTINQFAIPETELIFIGLRGAIVTNTNDQTFQPQQTLSIMDVNYLNPRCTILQWRTTDNKFAAFPASTVPHQRVVKSAVSKNGIGANCLMTGFYTDYRKGFHKGGSPTGHEAFRQNAPHPIRRTADDLDFDKDDRIEFDNPQDNIHCGWFDGISSDNYASAGCQVIMGFPKCQKPGRSKNIGPWKIFHNNAYSFTQNSFPYILFTGLEIFNVASGNNTGKGKLRYGSSGPLVEKLQVKLKAKNFYEGIIDGDFRDRTIKAVIAFQKQVFGNDSADGVVGPVTAEQLGLVLTL
ncbi:MAG: peptidoglycan-binding domain-containing protein [Ginsengibacter sp.]